MAIFFVRVNYGFWFAETVGSAPGVVGRWDGVGRPLGKRTVGEEEGVLQLCESAFEFSRIKSVELLGELIFER
jgi:hypothetical protein